jgi:2,4-dienoyl-CoA reductase-like NADH-dependent reductase (Old Yellow Enzyme family)
VVRLALTVTSSPHHPAQPLLAKLLSPARFGALPLKNRLVMAPMTREQSPGHVPNERNVEYYTRRARGGVGLIITEGTTIGHPGANGYRDVPAFDGEAALQGWRAVKEAVHGLGTAIIPQLWHVGSVRQLGAQPDPLVPGYGPSAVLHPAAADPAGDLPRELGERDIADIIEAYARAAASARELGFDGVEVHAAHGYLIHQFFSARSNRRTDRYGGDAIERTRFAVEVVGAVRRAVGPDFPICLRFSQWSLGDYTARLVQTPGELERWLEPLTQAGVDVYHASTRRCDDPEFEGSMLTLAGWTKRLSGKPVMTVGSIGLDSDFIAAFAGASAGTVGIERLLERLDRDEFDLVVLGRALLADPDWPEKMRAGRFDQITPFTPEHLRRYP